MERLYFYLLCASIILIGCNKHEPSQEEQIYNSAIAATNEDTATSITNDNYLIKYGDNKRRAKVFLDSLKKSDPDLYDGLFLEMYKTE